MFSLFRLSSWRQLPASASPHWTVVSEVKTNSWATESCVLSLFVSCAHADKVKKFVNFISVLVFSRDALALFRTVIYTAESSSATWSPPCSGPVLAVPMDSGQTNSAWKLVQGEFSHLYDCRMCQKWMYCRLLNHSLKQKSMRIVRRNIHPYPNRDRDHRPKYRVSW